MDKLKKSMYLKKFDNDYECDESGRMSRYLYKKETIEKIGLEYKKGRGYKIIVDNIGDLSEKAVIQQIFSYEGISPKIYKLSKFTGYDVFELEHINKNGTIVKNIQNKIREIIKKYPFILSYEVDVDNINNYINNKYVDFHGFQLNKSLFKDWLKNQVFNVTHWGHKNNDNELYPYQDCEWSGKRNMDYRIKQLQLNKINFNKRRVLDNGCNLGMFLHYVCENGGSGVGFDTEEVMNIASIYRFWFNPYADIEFVKPYGEFDYQFYLAMVHTLGYPEPIAPLTIFEGHNLQDKNIVLNKLNEKFSKIKFIGYSKDRGIRPVFWCWR